MLENIKVIIWDFDGTLYKLIPALKHDVREAEYRVIENHTKLSKEKVREEFHAIYKKEFQSATQVVAKLAHIPVVEAAHEMERYFDRTKYLIRDTKLIELFTKLTRFQHFLLVNGVKVKIEEALTALGLTPKIFTEIVTSEIVGENKPSLKGFRYILKKTGLPANAHLMIGDRVEVDLVPAKKLGMKTCLAWSDEKHPAVDITVPTIYDVKKSYGKIYSI